MRPCRAREQPAQELSERADVASAVDRVVRVGAVGQPAQHGTAAGRDDDVFGRDRAVHQAEAMEVRDRGGQRGDEAGDVVDRRCRSLGE